MNDRAFPVIYSADVAALAAFYERLGFRRYFQLPEEGEPGYVGMKRGTSELAVVDRQWPIDQYGLQPGPHPTFEMFVYVQDPDTLVSELATAGVHIVREPTDMPWGERVGFAQDPEGNVVALARAAEG